MSPLFGASVKRELTVSRQLTFVQSYSLSPLLSPHNYYYTVTLPQQFTTFLYWRTFTQVVSLHGGLNKIGALLFLSDYNTTRSNISESSLLQWLSSYSLFTLANPFSELPCSQDCSKQLQSGWSYLMSQFLSDGSLSHSTCRILVS